VDYVDNFRQDAACENGRRGLPVVALCVHSAESPEGPHMAERIRDYLVGNNRASVHACVDQDSIAGSVNWSDTPWHTGAGAPWNQMIIGVEHDGYASQTREQWLDAASAATLERSARLFAQLCRRFGIPARKVTPAQLAEAIRTRNPAAGGICSHHDITLAAGVRGGHWDPGPNFPWDHYIARVRAHLGGDVAVPNPDDEEGLMAAKDEIIAALKSHIDEREGHTRDRIGFRAVTVTGRPEVWIVTTNAAGEPRRWHVPNPATFDALRHAGVIAAVPTERLPLTVRSEIDAFLAIPATTDPPVARAS
jgi:hypothetical protein